MNLPLKKRFDTIDEKLDVLLAMIDGAVLDKLEDIHLQTEATEHKLKASTDFIVKRCGWRYKPLKKTGEAPKRASK